MSIDLYVCLSICECIPTCLYLEGCVGCAVAVCVGGGDAERVQNPTAQIRNATGRIISGAGGVGSTLTHGQCCVRLRPQGTGPASEMETKKVFPKQQNNRSHRKTDR